MLASQGTALVGNWPYRQIVDAHLQRIGGAAGREPAIEPMFEEIFSYCVNNSTDFLLAGYPFDLCLCDLKELDETKAVLEQLSRALMTGLNCRLFADAILLAHLDVAEFSPGNVHGHSGLLPLPLCANLRGGRGSQDWNRFAPAFRRLRLT